MTTVGMIPDWINLKIRIAEDGIVTVVGPDEKAIYHGPCVWPNPLQLELQVNSRRFQMMIYSHGGPTT